MASKVLNGNFAEAKRVKEDEFYTQLADIERELRHYKKHFQNKTVYCNCDDPHISNFFHYFSYSFEQLGLKRLITTCYKNQDANLFSRNDSDFALYLEYFGDKNGNMVPDPKEIGIKPLNGDGDFRSPESIDLLKQADIVVTNPPFSLFREYVAQLIKYDKKFIIVGNQNAISYAEIFRLIKDNKLWLGYNNGDMKFRVPDYYAPRDTRFWIDDEGKKWRSLGNACWFTNLDIAKRHESLILYKSYNPNDYPAYDNYDAIEVSKVVDIPADYNGIMGVPLTFLDKHNPDQFEILGLSGTDYPTTKTYGKKERVVDGVRKKSLTGTLGSVIRTESFGAGAHFDVGYPVKGTYRRLFIRRKGARHEDTAPKSHNP
ncbi:adenine-specific methyltransferase EcoRI family protein [Methylorubrum sp. B1-46]|uniref:adenine-specific methyltransferase EcoRI family protein n=1 Tax=Methylorubrum sp. B1-46 TaxID=2897334 RepID=UPI001E3A8BAF|nr:adenine-specific methyltransferase EcoRI family protein [Methylorubrum sp. B1-46]UGB26066.1 adenine-specific methyltransferase EcoRI family protein [Methylorubrum sp. B1-46]